MEGNLLCKHYVLCSVLSRAEGPRNTWAVASHNKGRTSEPVCRRLRHMRRMCRRGKGFTLVELLVVTGILAVLAAVGFSLSAPTREKARQTKCISNLKQLYQAVALYSSDHEGAPTFPGQSGIAFIYGSSKTALLPYTKNESVFYCPLLPEPLKGRLSSSYEHRWLAHRPDSLAADPGWAANLTSEYERDPSRYPMMRCSVHDKLYYYPRERQLDPTFSKAFLIDLRFDGSVASHRVSYPRIDFIIY